MLLFEVTSQFTVADLKSSVIIVEFGSTRDPEQLRKKVETMYNLAVNHAHGSVDCVFCSVNMRGGVGYAVWDLQPLTCAMWPVAVVKLMWSTGYIVGILLLEQ